MTDMLCGYIDRDETIVAFLYDDLDAGRRRDFEAHVLTCALCREEVAGLRSVRTQLARWEPPAVASLQSPASSQDSQPWWRAMPAWTQAAAALLFLGVSAGIANLDVRYDQTGLTVRTGWSTRPSAARGPAAPKLVGVSPSEGGPTDVSTGAPGAKAEARSAKADAPWRADLAALERQLKTEFHAAQVSASTAAQPVRVASSADAETLRRVRTMIEESDKRQQRELALRVAEMMRDVNGQRQADLIKIDRTLGVISNNTGVEVMKSRREMMDYIKLVSQRQ